MGLLRAFELSGVRFWFYNADHAPPLSHAAVVAAWEIRVYFLREPPQDEVKFAVKHVSANTVREILELAAAHRTELLEEWERNQSE